jgi:hypothetical protein
MDSRKHLVSICSLRTMRVIMIWQSRRFFFLQPCLKIFFFFCGGGDGGVVSVMVVQEIVTAAAVAAKLDPAQLTVEQIAVAEDDFSGRFFETDVRLSPAKQEVFLWTSKGNRITSKEATVATKEAKPESLQETSQRARGLPNKSLCTFHRLLTVRFRSPCRNGSAGERRVVVSCRRCSCLSFWGKKERKKEGKKKKGRRTGSRADFRL